MLLNKGSGCLSKDEYAMSEYISSPKRGSTGSPRGLCMLDMSIIPIMLILDLLISSP